MEFYTYILTDKILYERPNSNSSQHSPLLWELVYSSYIVLCKFLQLLFRIALLNCMLQKFFNSFNPDTENDPLFGEVEIHFNQADNTFYLMKDVRIGDYPDHLSLTIETVNREASQPQFELYKLIQENFMLLLESARSFMIAASSNDPIDANNYEAEAIYIGANSKGDQHWELSFLNTSDGSSYCIIEWNALSPLHFSIEE